MDTSRKGFDGLAIDPHLQSDDSGAARMAASWVHIRTIRKLFAVPCGAGQLGHKPMRDRSSPQWIIPTAGQIAAAVLQEAAAGLEAVAIISQDRTCGTGSLCLVFHYAGRVPINRHVFRHWE